MSNNCGQVNTPTTDTTPILCEEFRSARCTLYEDAIAYLGLPVNTPMNEVIKALVLSLTDARNRLLVLEGKPPKLINNQTGVTYELLTVDVQAIVTFNNALPVTLTIPEDADLNFAIGTEIDLINLGAGVVDITGVVSIIENIGSTMHQGDARTLVKVAADTWVIKY